MQPEAKQPADERHTEAMVRLARLWSAAMPSVEAFINASVRDPHDRDDLLQATSEYLARNFDKFEEGTSFVAWAVTVARIRMMEMWRDRSRRKLVLSPEAIEAVADAAVDLQDEVSDRQSALAHCIQTLGKHQRRLLDMRYTQALSPANIASKLGKTPNAVSAALMRVRTALRKCIETRLAGAEA